MIQIKPPTPYQIRFLKSIKRYVILSGGVGSGKTLSLAMKAVNYGIENPGTLNLIGTKTTKMLEDTTKRMFFEIVKFYELANGRRLILEIKVQHNSIKFVNGTEYLFRSFPDKTAFENIKSLTLDAIFLDEISDLPENAIRMAMTRLRGTRGDYRQLCGATNPAGFDNFVYRQWIEREDNTAEVIYSSSLDNPYLPEDYKNSLLQDYPDEYYRQYVKGFWGVTDEGVIYKSFDLSKHVVNYKKCRELSLDFTDFSSARWNYYRTIDYGVTNPFAVLYIAYDGERIIVFDEIYEKNLAPSDMARLVSESYAEVPFVATYIDPSATGLKRELAKQGVYASNAKNDVDDGIFSVKKAVSNIYPDNYPKLLVLDRCKSLIREFQSYRKTEKGVIIKENDHLLDALRYFIYTRTEKTRVLTTHNY
jgi:PBSX family phage terminase large subunit